MTPARPIAVQLLPIKYLTVLSCLLMLRMHGEFQHLAVPPVIQGTSISISASKITAVTAPDDTQGASHILKNG